MGRNRGPRNKKPKQVEVLDKNPDPDDGRVGTNGVLHDPEGDLVRPTPGRPIDRRDATVGQINMHDGRDRAIFRGSLSNKWGVTEGDMRRYKAALDNALDIAIRAEDPRRIQSCVNTMKSIVQQCVEDERHEGGDAEKTIEIRYVEQAPRWKEVENEADE